MNKWGRGVVSVWAVVAVLFLLFPPLIFRRGGEEYEERAWGVLFGLKLGLFGEGAVNVPLLSLIELVLAAVAAGLVFSRRTRP